MPQDSMKSVVYRSLVSCDDPNGVVDNETNRKFKIGNQETNHKIDTRQTRNGSNSSLVHKEERNEMVFSKRISEELQTPPSFQLLEVSRDAQNLNQMIDSWSKGTTDDGRSEDIARDLLRGALDLQESLIMLCKLQEASKFMSQPKRIHELKAGEDWLGVERVESGRFEETSYQRISQNPRFSIGGSSSRNCSEGLKKVIRESLSRQNLLTVSSTEDNSSLNQMKFDVVSDFPSTSSSQSSMVYSNDVTSIDSSVSSSVAQTKKAKSRSVIAKLMGLEEFPSESIQILPTQSHSEKNSNYRRPISDIEIPKAIRKPYFVNREADRERRTLKEIIETMQFKGILKRNSHVDRLKFGSNLPQTSISKHILDDEIPPIVIMKPLHREPKGSKLGQLIQEEGASYFKEEPRKMEAREEPLNQRFVKEEESVEPKEFPGKMKASEKTATKTLSQNDEVLESKNMSRKLEAKRESPTGRLMREDGNLMSNQILRKQRVKELKTTETASTRKMKDSVTQNHKPQKTEKPNKIVGNMQKTLPDRRKPVQMETAKASTAARSLDQVRAISTKSRKLEKGSIITSDRMHLQQSTTQNHIPKCSIKPISQNSPDQTKKSRTKKAKAVRDSSLDASITSTLPCKDGIKEIHQVHKSSDVSSTTSSLLADQLPTDVEAPRVQIEDQKEEDPTVLPEITVQIDQPGTSVESSEEAKQLYNQKTSFSLTEINLKRLFLSSPSFLNCAEDLFDLNIKEAKVLQTTVLEDVGMINTRLFLDCANELMEHRTRWNSWVPHPLIKTCLENPKISISLNGLVEEISDEIDIFRRYSKVDGENVVPVDNVLKMLENDLKRKEMMGNGGWDLGWRNGFSVNEVDQVVGEMEKQVLSEVIDDFIVDLKF